MIKLVKLGVFIIILATIFYISYLWYTYEQESKLAERALSIRKGMHIEEVDDLMGKPADEGIIDSAAVSRGWLFKWHGEYEIVIKKYDKVFIMKYFVCYYKLPFLRRQEGTVRVDVCFSPIERGVIYVSKYFATG